MNPQHSNKAPLSRLLFVLGTLLILPNLTFSQLNIEWEHTYGGIGYDELQAMALTADGGYIFGSITTSKNAQYEVTQDTRDTVSWPEKEGDFWLLKTDGDGNIEWDRRYGGEREDRLWSIAQTNDGGYILAGESSSGYWMEKTAQNWGGYDYWLVKIDADGDMEWQKSYGGNQRDVLRTVIPLADGYLLAGYSGSDASPVKPEGSRGAEDYWVIRTDLLGNPMWQKLYGGTGQDWLFEAQKSTNGFLLCGWSTSGVGFEKNTPNYGFNDWWVLNIDENGNVIWEKSFGGTKEDVILDASPTNDGGFLLTGKSNSPPSLSGETGNKTSEHYGGDDAWVIKINSSGNKEWEQSFGSSSTEYAHGAVENKAGNIMVAGFTFSEDSSITGVGNQQDTLIGSSDFWVLYLRPDGSKKWDMVIGGEGPDNCTKILKAHDYGFIMGGHSNSTVSPPYKSEPSRGGWNDLWVIRLGCLFPEPWLEDLPRTCQLEQFELDGTLTFCDGCEYLWDDGVTEPIRTVAPDVPTQYKVTVFHPDGCETSDSMLVEIVPAPEQLLASRQNVSCFNESDGAIYMDTVIGGTPPYLFSFNGGDYQAAINYSNMPPGVYEISILDANNCPLDTTLYITQPEEVLVELGDDIYLDLGESVQLQALTNQTDSFSISWGQNSILDCTDCQEPWASPSYTTTVSVQVVDKNGCEAFDNQRLIIKKGDSVYIPNSFSPNLDNINDFFTVYGDNQVRKVNSMLIFDRWGEQMFELHDFQPNVEQIGWDGKLDGKYMRPAVFGYWIEIEYLDGRTEFFEGDITLMR